jgi:hypothetical protein
MNSPRPIPGSQEAVSQGTQAALITIGLVAVFSCVICSGIAIISGNAHPSAHATATTGQTVNSQETFAAMATQDTYTPTPLPSTATAGGAAATATLKPAPPTATPRPAVPTATPIPQPPPTATPATLSISFTCAAAVDYSYGQVCVHTEPGAALQITVTYCSGYSATSKSLQGTEYADGGGNYEWDWTPDTKCQGQATADVTAQWQGQSAENTDTFTVQ